MQKTADEMLISDWSSDVGSSDLCDPRGCGASNIGRRSRSRIRGRGATGSRRSARRGSPTSFGCGSCATRSGNNGRRSSRRQSSDRKRVVEGQSVSVLVILRVRRLIKNKNYIPVSTNYLHSIVLI